MNRYSSTRVALRACRTLLCVIAIAGGPWAAPVDAEQIDIAAPASSVSFGGNVLVLPNGNIVIADSDAPAPNGGPAGAGAVYLYSPSGQLINALRGSHANDRIGSTGIIVLTNGNYVVSSSRWNGGVGATTLVHGDTGLDATVSASNSLLGAYNQSGPVPDSPGVVALANGNYVVLGNWRDANNVDVPAVTWGNGVTGVQGVTSESKSLVYRTGSLGSTLSVTALRNGHYVVNNDNVPLDGANLIRLGVITWCNGDTGTSGYVSASNSLVGGAAGDFVGSTIQPLSNGNYVVAAPAWRNGNATAAGAVKLFSGIAPFGGTLSAANALVGGVVNDRIGAPRYEIGPDGSLRVRSATPEVGNGNFVVLSPDWDNGAAVDAGAVTWVDGSTGIAGVVSASNSLVGLNDIDSGGIGANLAYITVLRNGHYVVVSPQWTDNLGIPDRGAVTWGNGQSGTIGTVSAANSMLGATAGHAIGLSGSVSLSNGDYAIASPNWGTVALPKLGAVTRIAGNGPVTGNVTAANSLVGASSNDQIGYSGLVALEDGSFATYSTFWKNAGVVVGAATWSDGSPGVVTAANSLIGIRGSSDVNSSMRALGGDAFVVASPGTTSGGLAEAGAVTLLHGNSGAGATVSSANSLFGSSAFDQVGETIACDDGNFIVRSRSWNSPTIVNAGAYTLVSGTSGLVASIGPANSFTGTVASPFFRRAYDSLRHQMVVAERNSNRVAIWRLINPDVLFADGLE